MRARAQASAPPLRTPSDSNIAFGHVAAAALLMDMYRPHRPNGRHLSMTAPMAARLAVGVPSKLVMRSTGGHTPAYDVAEIVEWFRRYLQ